MEIRMMDFNLQTRLVADRIYGQFPHLTTGTGVMLSKRMKEQIDLFLIEYNRYLKVGSRPYYRIDAYFSSNQLHVLEVNSAFVDGWGTALNLARASGLMLDSRKLVFPKFFATQEDEYLPELQLVVSELAEMGQANHEIVPYQASLPKPIYIYGRVNGNEAEQVFPSDGLRLDNKRNLAAFSGIWQSELVCIPRHCTAETDSWESIPASSVLKFCDKNGPESIQARASVLIGKPQGKSKFLRGCYESGCLLAQEYVQPTVHDLGNVQLVLLAIGDTLMTGYTQFSPKKIINDNSTHGPLCFE